MAKPKHGEVRKDAEGRRYVIAVQWQCTAWRIRIDRENALADAENPEDPSIPKYAAPAKGAWKDHIAKRELGPNDDPMKVAAELREELRKEFPNAPRPAGCVDRRGRRITDDSIDEIPEM